MAKGKLKKGWKKIAKFGLSPSRAAFLLAVEFNVLMLAKRLNQLINKKPDVVKNFWENFGGDFNKLKKVIEQGIKKEYKGLGIIVTTATISAALPIITAVLKLFSTHKSDKEGDNKFDDKAVKDINTEITNDTAGIKTGVKTIVVDENGKEVKNYTPLIIGGAVLLAGYFLMKRKK